MDPITTEFKDKSQSTVRFLTEDLKTIRTGRATPALVEDLQVTTYGGQSTLRLREIATITTEGPSALAILPFDQSTIQDVEKAILASSLGLSPAVQGIKIIVKVPALSEEQRQKFMKLIGQKIEDKKVTIRGHRDEARRRIRALLDKKEITEDGKFRLEKEIDTLSQTFMEEIQRIKDSKEREIMEV